MIAPELTDGIVTLRLHRPADTDDLIAMASDVETIAHTTVPVPFRPEHARQWITETVPDGWRDDSAHRWAVVHEGRFAGNLDIRRGDLPDIGYALAPWARGKGVMARAVRLATRWAFDVAGLPVVHWATHAGNLGSWRVAHACGFTFHGERPLSVPHRGELRDGWFASLRPGDAPQPRTTWWTSAVLEGERVRLRPHRDDDVPRLREMFDDPRSRHWLKPKPTPLTEDWARRYLLDTRLKAALGRGVGWAMADVDDDRLLGDVGIFGLDDGWDPAGALLGYVAHPDARGRGAVAEAVDLAVAHAFTPRDQGGLGRQRLQLAAAAGNTASRRVAERAGFRQAAQFHRALQVGRADGAQGAYDDGVAYELLAPR